MYMHVDVPMERVPIANWVLIAVTVLFSFKVFAEDASAGRRVLPAPDPAVLQKLNDRRLSEKQKQEIMGKELARLERLSTPGEEPILRYALQSDRTEFHVWQLLSYQFVHGDFWHLLGNMLFLFCFGNAINAKLGHGLFLGLYLLLGVFAGVGWLVLGSGEPLIGASGAIMGITGVFLVLYPLNEISVWTFRSWMWTGDAWHFPSWVFIVFYMVLDLFGTLIDRTLGGGGVAYICHLAGEFAGIGIGCALVRAGWARSGRGEQNLLEALGWVAADKPRKKRRRPLVGG